MSWRPDSKHREIQGARAPWNRATKPAKKVQYYDSQEEIDQCLSCEAYTCHPSICPKNPRARFREGRITSGRPRKEPPDNFIYYGRIETLKQLGERYGVSKSTLCRWREELGILPETREKKKNQ